VDLEAKVEGGDGGASSVFGALVDTSIMELGHKWHGPATALEN
jgi:hypothetical protein